MKFKTRNTYKRHLRTRHGKELMGNGVRMMPREQFLLIRTKPYLHDDQTTPEDVIQGLLSGQNLIADAEELLNSENASQEDNPSGYVVYEDIPSTIADGADIVKLEPL